MGWSTYHFREARSKMRYLGRLIHGPPNTLITRIFRHLRYTGTRTSWIRKINQLDRVYSKETVRQTAKNEREWNSIIKKEMKETENNIWQSETTKKRSMTVYSQHKATPAPESFYEGDKASGLLFQARTGSLPTRKRLSELFGRDSPTCTLCNSGKDEDIDHILRFCPALHISQPTKSLATILGFKNSSEDQPDVVETKRLLLKWDRQRTMQCRVRGSSPTQP